MGGGGLLLTCLLQEKEGRGPMKERGEGGRSGTAAKKRGGGGATKAG